jgi:colicin import membrane protein
LADKHQGTPASAAAEALPGQRTSKMAKQTGKGKTLERGAWNARRSGTGC